MWPCRCGCGEMTYRWRRNGKGRIKPIENFYIKNHDKRINFDAEETINCACGCGTPIKRWILAKTGRKAAERKFVLGHQSLGKPRPDFQKYLDENVRHGDKRNHPKGESHPNWKGGWRKTQAWRQTKEYKQWQQAVYRRDRWTCRDCGKHCKKGDIAAHHLMDGDKYPELRYDIDNGVTLHLSCHKRRHAEIGLATRFPTR